MIDLKKIALNSEEKIIRPTTIFSSLSNKSKKKDYLRNVQAEVLDKWFDLRDNRDNIIKMNTGSGKTTVGLLILQSCLAEEKGNCVYVVSDNFLLNQVKKEAADLGIKIVEDVNDPDYIRNNAILLITIQKLINGKSVFAEKYKIDNIVVDDVHACLEKAESQFVITINRNQHPDLYNDVLNLFYNGLSYQNYHNALCIKNNTASNPMIVPFWEVSNKNTALIKVFENYIHNEEFVDIMFPFEFLADSIKVCNIVIDSSSIELSPDFFPINKIKAFDEARRRIFMSATLKDDGKLIKGFNLKIDSIKNIIMPDQNLDIGNRMILYPQAINSAISDDEIKYKLKEISADKRVVVIVPSFKRAEFWNDVSDRVFDSKNISEIKKYSSGLDVLVNKYDGIDLSGDSCSYLVIDGLPNLSAMFDNYVESILRDTSKSTVEKMQKIEQGMGRGIRSTTDDCAVVIMGKNILNIIYGRDAIDNFSVSTKIQFQLSEKIAAELKNADISEIFDTFSYCLNRNADWLEIVNRELSNTDVDNKLNYNSNDISLYEAFKKAYNGNYGECINDIQKLADEADNEIKKGYYLFFMAKYTNLIDSTRAQELLQSAKKLNPNLYLPLEGINYKYNKNSNKNQTKLISEFITSECDSDLMKYLFHIENIASNVIFSDVKYDLFENSINELGMLLGFSCSMPDREYGKGPDNVWIVNNDKCLIIECKNEVTTDFICKKDCGQLLNSYEWAKEEFSDYKKIQPVIIHRSTYFSKQASPSPDFKIMTEEKLNELLDNVREYCKYLLSKDSFAESIISDALKKYQLDFDNIIKNYLISYKMEM